jgi:hypothetical protein
LNIYFITKEFILHTMSDTLKQEVIIKKSKRKLIVSTVISGLAAVFCIINACTFWADSNGKWLVIICGAVALGTCLFYIKEWRDHKIEMVISMEGVRLRGEGFYTWPSIESLSTDVDEGDVTLILKIRNQASVRFGITSLELDDEELIELLLSYGQPAGLTYSKH